MMIKKLLTSAVAAISFVVIAWVFWAGITGSVTRYDADGAIIYTDVVDISIEGVVGRPVSQTATLPAPTATLPAPTATLPAPTATLPAQTATLPAPTATLPAPTATAVPTSLCALGHKDYRGGSNLLGLTFLTHMGGEMVVPGGNTALVVAMDGSSAQAIDLLGGTNLLGTGSILEEGTYQIPNSWIVSGAPEKIHFLATVAVESWEILSPHVIAPNRELLGIADQPYICP
jgi:hypothetical protein